MTTAAKITANQAAALAGLEAHAGQTVEVLTSGYTANVAPEAVRRAVGGTMSSAALRGLEAKGFIRIEAAYWKGARITVIAAREAITAAIAAHYARTVAA